MIFQVYGLKYLITLFTHNHREKSLIHDEKTDSEKDRFEDVQTMAHELAHQFFGNLVTSDWWSDIWFNEGFSCMLESALVKHVSRLSITTSEKKYIASFYIDFIY